MKTTLLLILVIMTFSCNTSKIHFVKSGGGQDQKTAFTTKHTSNLRDNEDEIVSINKESNINSEETTKLILDSERLHQSPFIKDHSDDNVDSVYNHSSQKSAPRDRAYHDLKAYSNFKTASISMALGIITFGLGYVLGLIAYFVGLYHYVNAKYFRENNTKWLFVLSTVLVILVPLLFLIAYISLSSFSI